MRSGPAGSKPTDHEKRWPVLLAALVALLAPARAETIRVSVFGLFRPDRLTVRTQGGRAIEVRAWDLAGDVRASGDFVLSVPGRIERRFRGDLTVTKDGGVLHAIIEMNLETAVASAVAAESPPGAGLEALKAQAVVTRAYYKASRGRHAGFDFCDTTHCQFLREPVRGLALRAAQETRGVTLAYEGHVVAALFHASCGGRTRTPEEVGMQSGAYPYFPVECEACRRSAKTWSTRLRAADARVLGRGASEEARLEIGRRSGWSAVPSNNFTLAPDGDGVRVEGRGAGHGIGLCQSGAAAMAASGAGFREILDRYFPGAAVR